MLLTIERLRAVLDYDPETGEFVWRTRPREMFGTDNAHRTWNTRYAGTRAGVSTHGYRKIAIDDAKHYAHRLAWLWMYGQWPKELIDHINGVRDDNRIANLREAGKALNALNTRGVPVGATGMRGVTRHRSGYMAQINHEGRHFYLGLYKTAEAAGRAYEDAALRLRQQAA